MGASKVQGNSSLGVKEGRKREMIRPLSWNRVLWKTSPFPGALLGLGAALCLCPSAPIPLLSTTLQGMQLSSKPTFRGFSTLGAGWRPG